jgi:hypothetical protein
VDASTLAAEAIFEEGITEERVSAQTVRVTLERMGVRWLRAKRWITSPDPEYERKKAARPADSPLRGQPEWVVGFEDEAWWSSRLAIPSLHASWRAGIDGHRACSSSRSPKMIPSRRPSSARGCSCRSLRRHGCALWMDAP